MMSGKSATEERRTAMRKRAERALKEQQQIADARAEKTAKLRAARLARDAAGDQPDGQTDEGPPQLPKTHRPQF